MIAKYKIDSTLQKSIFIVAVLLCLSSLVSSPVALVGGFLFVYLFGHPFPELNSKAVSLFLKVAVVGLGFGMNITETLEAGQDGFLLTVGSIVFTLVLGYFIGQKLGMEKRTSHLLSSGTAICGGSAIAAVAPVINATEKDMSVSLGVVFLLNSVALVLFPVLGHLLSLDQHQFGLWSAIAIHDTSSVVGAAYAYGDEALRIATTVKLARALWIIPLSIVSLYLFKGKGKSIKIPWFIFLFLVAILLNTYLPIPELLTSGITTSAKSLLVLTLFLIGAGLSVEKIKSAGWKPMILGLSLWVAISVVSLLVIVNVY
ncbi:MAG: putative sulfate exporter family transporter [Candidatus Kapaibacterium sp.]